MGITRELAHYIAGTKFEDLPPNVVGLAKQLVLANGPYHTCHPLLEPTEKTAAKSPAETESKTPST